ncbi:MAG: O-antigen ligase family protein [Acidobacteria bacterium]|nr:O-antigen ligase family protein [Acidobacteriota bacterium]
MPSNRQAWDYESVTRASSATRLPREEGDELSEDLSGGLGEETPGDLSAGFAEADTGAPEEGSRAASASRASRVGAAILKRGHGLTYASLVLFTVVLYLRPAELYPSPLTASIAFFIGTFTLAVFFLSQLTLEGTLTARPREVNLLLLFCLFALLSIPFALDPGMAWDTFSGVFIRCVVIFVVMVNAVRTQRRLRGMLLVALLTGIILSAKGVNDYRLGNLTIEGYRVGGVGEGIFGNPNDLALFLVTVAPVAVAMLLGSRSVFGKLFYAAASLLMLAAVVVTFSRGAFLGLAAALGLMAWKVGRRNRVGVVLLGFACVVVLLALAPGEYLRRLLSIFMPGLDPVGSSDMRRQILMRSVWTAIVNPINGIGMGNFPLVSLRNLVSHNAYTQVAAEMGLPALAVYLMFLLTPFKGLSVIERETHGERKSSRFYYLAVGLQASLVGYVISSFFASVAYVWYVYYVVGYAVCLRRIYESEGAPVAVTKAPADEARADDEGAASGLGAVAGG